VYNKLIKTREANTMKYNKSKIMTEAWRIFKNWKANGQQRFTRTTLDFAQALRVAWSKAKEAVIETSEEINKIDEAIFVLNMKDHLNTADFDTLNELEIKRSALLAA